jgi:hypothetical protein
MNWCKHGAVSMMLKTLPHRSDALLQNKKKRRESNK